jgi:hypothetical protein
LINTKELWSESFKDLGNTTSKEMGDTELRKEVVSMPWKDVTFVQQR